MQKSLFPGIRGVEGRCPRCGLPVDPRERAQVAKRGRAGNSLFHCVECGQLAPQRRLPRALEGKVGAAVSTDPDSEQGAALFYTRGTEEVVLTCWVHPSIAGNEIRLTRAELLRFLDLDKHR